MNEFKVKIQSIFNNDFTSVENFLDEVLEPIFGEYEKGYEILTDDIELKEKAKKANIDSISHKATFELVDSELKFFEVILNDNSNIQNSRVGIQEIIRRYTEQFGCSVMIFHYKNPENRSWRFSYVEKGSSLKVTTSAKRYTYMFGVGYPCKTASDRFDILKNKNGELFVKDLTDAFDVEPLSDEFFYKYLGFYSCFVEYLTQRESEKSSLTNSNMQSVIKWFHGLGLKDEKNQIKYFKKIGDDEKSVRDYVKKMMGRLIFLQFLQKKGWMGVPTNEEWGKGDVDFTYNLFKKSTESQKENFLENVLEPIFFDCLNRDRRNDGDKFDTKVKAIGDNGIVRIPYLNGGLFKKDAEDDVKIVFPSVLFGKLFEFFNEYNFTIDESDTSDVQVGIAPEMLSKIFENLLEDNKDKGAFYTPKSIVNYMCRESLIQYLTRKTNEDENTIRAFVEDPYVNINLIPSSKNEILRAIKDVKICDPAVGSGAFPMGLLQLLYECRVALGEVGTENSDGIKLTKSMVKQEIVKKNIYGVDIEKGAVDIARLRFWLSIVIDETEPKPLPNLDYKIMQGNSLIEDFEGFDLSKLLSVDSSALFDSDAENIEKLENALNDYYEPQGGKSKEEIIKAINETVRIILREKGFGSTAEEGKERTEDKFAKLNISATPHFFMWHTWFCDVFNRKNGSENGFDIVIGNPPYLKERDNADTFNPVNNSIFGRKYHQGKMDFWFYFLHKSIELACKDAVISFITSRYWIKSSGAKKLFKHLKEELSFRSIVDIGNLKVFDNVVGNHMIAIYEKSKDVEFCEYIKLTDDVDNLEKKIYAEKRDISNSDLISEMGINLEKTEISVECKTLDKYFSVAQGVVEASDKISSRMYKKNPNPNHYVGEGIFVLTKEEIDSLDLNNEEKDIFVPYAGNEWSFRFVPDYDDNHFLIYSDKKIKELISANSKYKNIKKHLDKMGEYITSDNRPYGIHRARENDIFIANEKVVGPSMFESPQFCLDNKGWYYGMSYNLINSTKDSPFSLKVLVGILNSSFAKEWFYKNAKLRGVGVDVGVERLRTFPLPKISENDIKEIEEIVSKIINHKEKDLNCDTTNLEIELDNLINQVYGISEK